MLDVQDNIPIVKSRGTGFVVLSVLVLGRNHWKNFLKRHKVC